MPPKKNTTPSKAKAAAAAPAHGSYIGMYYDISAQRGRVGCPIVASLSPVNADSIRHGQGCYHQRESILGVLPCT